MSKNTRRFLIFFLVILLVVIGAWLLIVYGINRQASKYTTEGEGIKELKELNSEVVNMAQSYKITAVRGIESSDIYTGELKDKLQIIVYEDYSNYYNAVFNQALEQAQERFGDQIIIAYRPYPLQNQGLSMQAALAVECAQDQFRALEYRDKLYEQTLNKSLSLDTLPVIAENLDLNIEDFSACLSEHKYQNKISGLVTEGKTFSVFGAPTTFVADEMVIGARPWDDSLDSNQEKILGLENIIQKHLK